MQILLSLTLILALFGSPAFAKEGSSTDWMAVFSKMAQEYESLFENGDAKGISDLWQEDGFFTLSDGTKLLGRKNIHSYYKQYFKDAGPEKITVKVTSIKELVPGKAIIEVGTTRPDDAKKPTAQYRVLHVNTNGKWKVAWAEETSIPRNYSLKDLEWLVGTWSTKSDAKSSIEIEVSRISKGSFLQVKNISAGHRVIIGLDPASGLLHSWHFDSKGGIGEGDWEISNGKWSLRTLGLTSDGAESRAIYSLDPISKNKFLWGSTERFIEGSSIPDLEEVEMSRLGGGK